MSTIALHRHLDWPGVGQVCCVVRERVIRGQGQTETAYYVTSRSRRQADAARLARLVRDHWSAIENGLHRVRDVTLGEDRCLIRRGHAPQNLAAIRNSALNWLRRTGGGNLVARIRSFIRNSQRLLAMFGYVKLAIVLCDHASPIRPEFSVCVNIRFKIRQRGATLDVIEL